jgi:GT2 family glycosyltransferase
MQVSFIIPLYNCLAYTRVCVRTLQASLPSNLSYEIILVDDGSSDGTREWLTTLAAPFRVILNERNLGYAAANNRGAAQARGQLLVLLNNDLVFLPRWLEPMIATHRRLSAPGLIGNIQHNAASGLIDHTGIFFNHKCKPTHDTFFPFPASIYPGHRLMPAITGACTLVSNELWRKLGGFDEGFINGSEDVDLCLRARAAGHTNAVSLRSSVLHHISASPGRRLRDEENSRRLTLRWRKEIARLAAPAWCQHHLETTAAHPRSLALLAYWLGWRPEPPALVRQGVEQALTDEITRWKKMFG